MCVKNLPCLYSVWYWYSHYIVHIPDSNDNVLLDVLLRETLGEGFSTCSDEGTGTSSSVNNGTAMSTIEFSRPPVLLDGTDDSWVKLLAVDEANEDAWPSGHTSSAFGFSLTL